MKEMAPKRQKKAVVKRMKKVVEETVHVAVVDEESNGETVEREPPPTRVVEVCVGEKQDGIDSITVVRSEEKRETRKGRKEEKGREAPVSVDVEQGKGGGKERGEEDAREENSYVEKRKERKNESRETGGLEQGKEGGAVEGGDGKERNARGENRASVEEITDMGTETLEEGEGEKETEAAPVKGTKRKTIDELHREEMETEAVKEPATPKKAEARPKKEGATERKKRKREKMNAGSVTWAFAWHPRRLRNMGPNIFL